MTSASKTFQYFMMQHCLSMPWSIWKIHVFVDNYKEFQRFNQDLVYDLFGKEQPIIKYNQSNYDYVKL